jgi:hypothetical protein
MLREGLWVFIMSMDYPLYEKLCKKSRALAILWRIGDMGYYIGLFGAIASPVLFLQWMMSTNSKKIPWDRALGFHLGLILFFVLVNWGAGMLKYFALKKGGVLDNDHP